MVRKKAKQVSCLDVVTVVQELAMAPKTCQLKFGSPIVMGSSVTLIGLDAKGTLQYSDDNINWQDSPTLLNQPAGTRLYYIREAGSPGCNTSGNATVLVGSCVGQWVNEEPAVTDCIGGKINFRQIDGCGKNRWQPTAVSCTDNSCVPNWIDVVPEEKECFNYVERIRTTDGCGHFSWRAGDACNTCTPNWTDVIPEDKECLNGVERVRTTDGCGNFDYRTGAVCCSTPSFTLTKEDPTCDGETGATLNNGKLSIIQGSNCKRYQLCQDDSFTCVPDFANAFIISGEGNVEVSSVIGLSTAQASRHYTVRVYGVNQYCYFDSSVEFINSCEAAECVLPTCESVSTTPATCAENGTPNDDAMISLSGVSGADRIGVSIGTVYSGPDYAAAPTLMMPLEIDELPGSNNDTDYVIRIMSSETCYTDIPVTISGSVCFDPCCTMEIGTITLNNI